MSAIYVLFSRVQQNSNIDHKMFRHTCAGLQSSYETFFSPSAPSFPVLFKVLSSCSTELWHFTALYFEFWFWILCWILQELLFSYNIAVDRSDEVKRILGKSAASVGLQLPEVYQPWLQHRFCLGFSFKVVCSFVAAQ